MKKLLINISAVILVVGAGTGCQKFLDINNDPNRPTQPPINGLVAAATQNSALNNFRVGNTVSYYTQYLASPNAASPTDVYDRVDFSGTWRSLFDNLTDIYDLEKMAIEKKSSEHLGVAKILKAHDLSIAISIFGSIPFTEAFSGEFLTPKYDSEESIFNAWHYPTG